MRRTLTRLTVIVAFLLYVTTVPPAMSEDVPHGDDAKASAAAPEGGAERVTPADDSDAGKSKGDEQAPDAAAVEEPARDAAAVEARVADANADADALVCRKETPTGSHRRIVVCRRPADIDASSAEVQSTMNRVKQYANPTVTPSN